VKENPISLPDMTGDDEPVAVTLKSRHMQERTRRQITKFSLGHYLSEASIFPDLWLKPRFSSDFFPVFFIIIYVVLGRHKTDGVMTIIIFS
jgi:hypothetical protein